MDGADQGPLVGFMEVWLEPVWLSFVVIRFVLIKDRKLAHF